MRSYLTLVIVSAIGVFLMASMSSLLIAPVSATHTTRGATYWLKVCNTISLMIAEPCGTLVSNHDPYGQGLSTDGWRVAKCVAGGALLTYAGHPELLTLGPVVGCASNNGVNTLLQGNGVNNLLQGNGVKDLLQGLFK